MGLHALLLALTLPAAGAQPPAGATPILAAAQDGEGGMQEEFPAELQAQLIQEQEQFDPLYNRFYNELQGYLLEVRALRKNGTPASQFPPSPVLTYFPFVEALSNEGNGPARLWMVRYSDEFIPDEADRANFCRETLTLLAEEHASGSYMMESLEDVKLRRDILGEEFLLEYYRKLQENSLRLGLQARAYYAEAEQLLAKGGYEDPERKKRADEIFRILVDGYPKTKPAVFAGSRLFDQLIKDMHKGWADWLVQLRELNAQGTAVADLPPAPMEEFQGRMFTIGGTEHKLARRWLRRFFPAHEQASREGFAPGVAVMANWFSMQFSPTSPPWNELKFGLLDFLYTVEPDGEHVLGTVQALYDHCERNQPEDYVPILGRLIANTGDPQIRYEAMLTKARSMQRGRTSGELAEAARIYAEVEADAPLLEQRDRGRDLGRSLSWTMPGAVHQPINTVDSDGVMFSTLDYEGSVLVLYFWTEHLPGCVEDLEWMNGFARRNSDRGVSVLGVNIDFNSQGSFLKKVRQYGITFRNCLMQSRKALVVSQYQVAQYPTVFVIDDQGVVRGRNLSHQELDALVAQLLAEREGAQAALASRGRLEGVARYRGTARPLPPLEVDAERAAECAEMDRTDRSRLVAEDGGLANVVVTIENRGDVHSGEGQVAVLKAEGCRFEPHVLLVPRDAKLELQNGGESVTHVQVSSANNRSFKTVMPPGFTYQSPLKAADRFQVRSISHPWMSAWVVVTDSPHTVLTDATGRFEVPDLPAGDYVATWWHESLGRGQSAEFRIRPGEATSLELTIGRP